MYFRLEGAGWCYCCSWSVPWEDPIPQHVLTSWTWTVPPHLAMWLLNPPEADGVITVSRPAWRLPFMSRKELKTRSSGLSWPLFLPLAVRTLSSGRRVLPLGLEWEGLAQRSSLGGLQRHHPREPRGWGCAEPLGPGLSVDLDRVDSLPEACGAPPHPSGLLLTPPPPPSTGLPPWQGSLNPQRGSSFSPPPLAGLLSQRNSSSSAVVLFPRLLWNLRTRLHFLLLSALAFGFEWCDNLPLWTLPRMKS